MAAEERTIQKLKPPPVVPAQSRVLKTTAEAAPKGQWQSTTARNNWKLDSKLVGELRIRSDAERG